MMEGKYISDSDLSKDWVKCFDLMYSGTPIIIVMRSIFIDNYQEPVVCIGSRSGASMSVVVGSDHQFGCFFTQKDHVVDIAKGKDRFLERMRSNGIGWKK